MAAQADQTRGRRGGRWTMAMWLTGAALLLAPLVAMRFTTEVDWDGADFAFAGVMIFLACGAVELAVRASSSLAYRAGVVFAVGTAFLLVWATGAVGVIGSEDNPANLMFAGVLLSAVVGSSVAAFRARGMATAMFATAVVQVAVGLIALTGNMGTDGAIWPMDVIGATAVYATGWLLAGGLFRRAGQDGA